MEAYMHCPNCGAKAADDQKFCRSCGLKLERVSLILAEQLTPAELSLLERQREIERWRKVAYRGTLAVGAIGLLGLFVYEMAIENNPLDVLIIVTILIILIGAALSASLNIYSASLREKLISRKSDSEALPLDGASTTKQLPEVYYEPVPSVTEHTTELLVAVKKSGAKES